ncbi:unnamed protein product [Hydatigera taeniaeformis]|uniref:Mitochondrial carrier protein n=1 Tax=Hydatigena taeniaeformis TaxID=6205 RepID=A0A0R3WVD0_HYDTA|nr:unnamed protein product [Hydatigera taeniaeformis]
MWSNKLKEMEKSPPIATREPLNTATVPESQIGAPADVSRKSTNTSVREMVGYGLNVSSAITDVLFAHPFLVLRHQCQGVLSLWKGLSGAITVKVVRTISENGLSEVLPLPKEITIYSSAAKISLHFLLKLLSWIIVTPFYAASMVEFVQSDIASEPTTLVSCLLEGLRRLLPSIPSPVSRMGSVGGKLKAGLRASPIRTSRLLPVWRLIIPVVTLGVGQHIIRSFVSFGVSAYLGRDQEPEQLDMESTESCNIMVRF